MAFSAGEQIISQIVGPSRSLTAHPLERMQGVKVDLGDSLLARFLGTFQTGVGKQMSQGKLPMSHPMYTYKNPNIKNQMKKQPMWLQAARNFHHLKGNNHGNI